MKTEVYADGTWHELEGIGNELVTYDISDIGQVQQVRISWEEGADLQLYEIASVMSRHRKTHRIIAP